MDRQSGRRTRETARCVTCAVTETIVEGARPRDDAASEISESSLTEVEIAIPRHASRHVTGMARAAAAQHQPRHPELFFQLLPYEGMIDFGFRVLPPALLLVGLRGWHDVT
jgi:hypothetical protein